MPIMLLLKKTAARVVFPVSFITILLIVGVCLLSCKSPRKRAAGKWAVLAATVLLYCAGIFGNVLLERYMDGYPRLNVETLDPTVRYTVCVVGSSYDASRNVPPKLRFNEGAALRMMEAARICAEMNERNIDYTVAVSVGGLAGLRDDWDCEEATRSFLADFGVPGDRVRVFHSAWTTRDEIKLFKELGGKAIIIAQPTHIPRIVTLAKKYGVEAIAAPGTTHSAVTNWKNPLSYIPAAGNVCFSETLIYELLGQLEYLIF